MPDYSRSVFKVCADIHSSVTGGGDQLSDEEMLSARRFLQDRLYDWTRSLPCAAVYDEAVRSLIVAAIFETTPGFRALTREPEICGADNSIPYEYTTIGAKCQNSKPCPDHDENGNRRRPWR